MAQQKQVKKMLKLISLIIAAIIPILEILAVIVTIKNEDMQIKSFIIEKLKKMRKYVKHR